MVTYIYVEDLGRLKSWPILTIQNNETWLMRNLRYETIKITL